MPAKDPALLTSSALVEMTNGLLMQLNHPLRIHRFTDLNANVFVTLYEAIIAEPLPGVIRAPKSTDEEIYNCQKVIDTLADKILKDNLSHIKGADVVARKKRAIFNLLEVLAALLEYFLAKIGSETSSENGIDNEEEVDDPDLVRPELIDDALDRELQRSVGQRKGPPSPMRGPNRASLEVSKGNDTEELIALGKDGRDSRYHISDRTADLVALGNDSRDGVRSRGTADTEPLRDSSAMDRGSLNNSRTNRFQSTLSSVPNSGANLRTASDHKSSGVSTERSESLNYPPLEEILRTRPELDHYEGAASTRVPQDSLPDKGVSSGRSESAGAQQRSDRTYTHHLYHHFDRDSALGADLVSKAASDGKPMQSESAAGKYEHLEAALRETLHMSREALLASPFTAGVPSRTTQVQTNTSDYSRSAATSAREHVSDNRSFASDRLIGNGASSNEKRVTFQAANLSDHLAASSSNVSLEGGAGVRDKLTVHAATAEKAAGTTPSLRRQPDIIRESDVNGRSYGGRLRSFSESDVTDYDDLADAEGYSAGSCEDIHLSNDNNNASYDRDTNRRRQREAVHDKLERAARLEQILDDSAPGEMRGIRKKLQKETDRVKKGVQVLDKVYRNELSDYKDDVAEELEELLEQASLSERLYQKKVQRPLSSRPPTAYKKRKEPVFERKQTHAYLREKKRSRSASPSLGQPSQRGNVEELLPQLLEEFPYLHLSGETLHNMWRKHARQMELLSRAGQEIKRSNQVKVQLQDAERRQKILLEMMHRDAEHTRKMKELKERREAQQQVRAQIRDKKQQHVRAKRYYGDYQVQMRSKMLKRRTREEQLFRKLFQEALDIQRNRIRELRAYAKEMRSKRSEQQKVELDAIENYYRDQFAMLKDRLVEEKKDLQIREKSQSKVVSEMKKELRKKMEHEIEQIQSQLCRDEDDIYFRELDADRQRRQLLLARYEARI